MVHTITSYSRVSVGGPGSSNFGASVEYAELIEAKDLAKSTSHGNAAFSSPNDKDGVIGIASITTCRANVADTIGTHLRGHFCLTFEVASVENDVVYKMDGSEDKMNIGSIGNLEGSDQMIMTIACQRALRDACLNEIRWRINDVYVVKMRPAAAEA
jgi:hypothetical protein